MKRIFWVTVALSFVLARFDELAAVPGAFAILLVGGLWLVVGLFDIAEAGEEGRTFWNMAACVAAVVVVGFWLTPAAPVALGLTYWTLAAPGEVVVFIFLLGVIPAAVGCGALWLARASWRTTRTVVTAPDLDFYRRRYIRPQ